KRLFFFQSVYPVRPEFRVALAGAAPAPLSSHARRPHRPRRPVQLMLTLRIARGRCLPLGASAQPDGVNFALLCRHGTAVFLGLHPLDGTEPLAEIALHPRRNRTGDHWHVLVAGLPPAFTYGWRVDGPRSVGHCYDANTVLLDPAATALTNGARWGLSREPE